MAGRKSSEEFNPYRPPQARSDELRPITALPEGQTFLVDGDALICRSDLTLDWLCLTTGLPVERSLQIYKTKLFAPSLRRRWPFTFFHSISISMLLLMLVAGRIMNWGQLRVFNVPAFVWFWIGVIPFIFVLVKTPGVRLYYRRSKEGSSIHRKKTTFPAVAFGILVVGPTLIVLPQIFTASAVLGIAVFVGLIIASAIGMMLLPHPFAVTLPNGDIHIKGLSPRLLHALRETTFSDTDEVS